MTLLADTRTANNNVALQDELTRKIGNIESQVVAWMAEATTLHGAVDAADKAEILAMRADLVDKLTAATVI